MLNILKPLLPGVAAAALSADQHDQLTSASEARVCIRMHTVDRTCTTCLPT
jgi:hypothetical protein